MEMLNFLNFSFHLLPVIWGRCQSDSELPILFAPEISKMFNKCYEFLLDKFWKYLNISYFSNKGLRMI